MPYSAILDNGYGFYNIFKLNDKYYISYAEIFSNGSTYAGIDSIIPNLSAVATSGKYSDLSDTPTKLSDFENDKGYITDHQDISGKADKTTLDSHVDDTDVHITSNERVSWNSAVTELNSLINLEEVSF